MASNAATANFLTTWRQVASRQPCLLVKIDLTVPSAKSIYLADTWVRTPDGITWDSVIVSADAIRADHGVLSPGPNLCSASIVVASRRKLSWQTALNDTIIDVMQDWLWEGAAVTMYLWDKKLTSTADRLQVFSGIVDELRITNETSKLDFVQRQSWRVNIPRTHSSIDNPEFFVPIVYGDHLAEPAQEGVFAPGDTYNDVGRFHDMGGGLFAVPGIAIDKKQQVFQFASHYCNAFGEANTGTPRTPIFIAGSKVLAHVQPGLGELFNDPVGMPPGQGSAFPSNVPGAFWQAPTAGDSSPPWAVVGILPVAVRTGTGLTTCLNPGNALDIFDGVKYATLSTGQTRLQLAMPDVATLGQITSAFLYVIHQGSPVQMSYSQGMSYVLSANRTTFAGIEKVNITPYVNNDWRFGAEDLSTDILINCASGSAKIYGAAIVVEYRPTATLVAPESRRLLDPPQLRNVPSQNSPSGYMTVHRWNEPMSPAIYETDSVAYANLKGYQDDGSGTYTGSAAGLIENAPDIAHHILRTYGGLAASDIELGASAFGSFVVARSSIRRGQLEPWRMAVHIGRSMQLNDVLADIARQSASNYFIDRFTGKFVWLPWDSSMQADYDLTIKAEHLAGPVELIRPSSEGVVQRVRVSYGMDYFRGRTMRESVVSDVEGDDEKPQTSVGTLADDYIIYYYGSTLREAIPAGTYTQIDYAAAVRQTLATPFGGEDDSTIMVGHGFTVKAGYNDKLNFSDAGATLRVATLTAGKYTAVSFAAEAKRALEAAYSGITWTITYNFGTCYWSIKASTNATLRPATGANRNTSGWGILGMRSDRTLTANVAVTSDHFICADRFWLCQYRNDTSGNFILSNGIDGPEINDAGKRMGFPFGSTASLSFHVAKYTRGDRRAAAASSKAIYGEQEEMAVTAQWVRDDRVASRLRNALFDSLNSQARVVHFRTQHCPDVRRGAVLTFDLGSLVRWPAYGGTASWIGRRFRVINVLQYLTPSWETEITAVELL
jgi:hypothetical protein